jgi:hypothetical protein
MAVVEVVMVPLGTGTPSLSKYVAGVEKVLDRYGKLKHTLTPMSTIIEGDLDISSRGQVLTFNISILLFPPLQSSETAATPEDGRFAKC